MVIFVFLMSEIPYIPYFKVRGKLFNFLKNRLVDPQEYIIRFLYCDIGVLYVQNFFILNSKVKEQIRRMDPKVDVAIF